MNSLEVGLAFLEGVALILSPCILPVLPLVLSTSIEGGNKRPFGIILGFVVAFSGFVLMSREIIQLLHIDLDLIKYISYVLLFLFGLIMVSERLSQKFTLLTQGAANAGQNLTHAAGADFGSGVMVGALIGLVWTPCAGPILAAVLVQVIKQQTTFEGVVVTLAFAVGAALPMLAIALLGRQVIGRLGFFARHAEGVRKTVGGVIIVTVAFLAFGPRLPIEPGKIAMPTVNENALPAEAPLSLQNALTNPYIAPEVRGATGWLNSPPLTIAELNGKVVLVDFWTYSCVNCVRTLPYLLAWDRKYRAHGLVIIGVHSPEFEFEKKTENVQTALSKYGITYPVAIDNDLAIWGAFKNQYWPAHYLIDKNGNVVYTHFGEGDYGVTENNIRYLLGLNGKVAETPQHVTLAEQTPETYLGYARAARYVGDPSLVDSDKNGFTAPADVPESNWALSGSWHVESQKITSGEGGAKLLLHFKARKVFLVMGVADGTPHRVSLKLDGAGLTNKAGTDVSNDEIAVTGHALYELISQPYFKDGLLEITAGAPGVELYAFTFGD